MFRPLARTAAPAARAHAHARSFVSRATFVGRLGTAPEKSTTSAGQPYYKYPLAVSKPPKRDAEGSKSRPVPPRPCSPPAEVILDEGGCQSSSPSAPSADP